MHVCAVRTILLFLVVARWKATAVHGASCDFENARLFTDVFMHGASVSPFGAPSCSAYGGESAWACALAG